MDMPTTSSSSDNRKCTVPIEMIKQKILDWNDEIFIQAGMPEMFKGVDTLKRLKENSVIPLDDPIRILVTKCVIWKLKNDFGRLLGKRFEGTLATVAEWLVDKFPNLAPKNDFYYKDKTGSIRGHLRWRYYNTEKPERIVTSIGADLKFKKRKIEMMMIDNSMTLKTKKPNHIFIISNNNDDHC
uniref:Uncharacterized protein LOC113794331 n=1 Tax=Dermatophagoides pteronyssinus TaxID=6956 RepID=A0A6P6Y433_DERPT